MNHRLSRHCYRWLLRFAPGDLRETHGAEIERLFLETLASETTHRGVAGFLHVWIGGVADLLLGRLRSGGSPGRDGPSFPVPRPGTNLATDLRSAWRALRHRPALVAIVSGTLAVGIGAAVSIFSVLYGVLLQPLPFPEPGRLVALFESNADLSIARQGPAPGNLTDWRELNRTFVDLAAGYLRSSVYQDDDRIEQIETARVTESFFAVLGVRTVLGRGFRDGDDTGTGSAVVLSYRTWTARYGQDPSVVGRTVRIGGEPHEIVGILPADFAFLAWQPEVWIAWDFSQGYTNLPAVPRDQRFLTAVGRLRTGVTPEAARTDLDGIAAELGRRYPATNRGWRTQLNGLREETIGGAGSALAIAMAAGLFILILAAVNVTNVLVARMPARRREFAVRSALGAHRFSIVRQLVCESLILSTAGGLAGVAVAFGLTELLIRFDAGNIPRLEGVGLNWAVLAFATLTMVVTGLIGGVVPNAHVQGDLAADLRANESRTGEPRGSRRIRDVLVVVEVGLAVVLTAGAALFARSLEEIRSVDPGLDPHSLLSFRVALEPGGDALDRIGRYYPTLIDSLSRLPGVTAVGASTALPFDPLGNDFNRPYRLPGTLTPAADAPLVQMRMVTPDLFSALGMSFREGTPFTGLERLDDPRVAVVNATLARSLWGDRPATGEVVEIFFRDGWQPYRVTGVVNDVRHLGQRRPARPEVFLSNKQIPYLAMTVVVRTAGDPSRLVDPVRSTLRAVDPAQPAHRFVTMQDLLSASLSEERFLVVLLGTFAAVAILLAAAGVYGVLSYSVGQSRREIGLRLALGATPAGIRWRVLGRALMVTGAGVVVGLGIHALGAAAVAGIVYDVSPFDARLLAGVVAILTGAAALAAWVPARRASGVQPATTLRGE